MTIQTSLMASFRPGEWGEEDYARAPPYVMENNSGRVFLVPRDHYVEATLDSVSPLLGLKKRRQGHVSYLVSRADAIKALRQFDWFVRRSWRSGDLAVVWALVHLGEKRKWASSDVSLQAVAELSGQTPKECAESLARLFHARAEGSFSAIGDYASDKKLVTSALEQAHRELPTWTEEVVMGVLCSSSGGSVADIYESVIAQGLSVGAVYKVLERLKGQGYVFPARFFRVNDRGPMREMLSADCRNCFFGFTNPDVCLQDSLRQLEDVLQRDFGKVPTREERSGLYASMKGIPYSSRTNRRVLASLRLMHELDAMVGEGRVSGLLRKIEEHYGVELPVKPRAAPAE